MILRIIGDVHGKQKEYVDLAKQAPDGHSICLGDVGFDYSYIIKNLNSEQHKIIGGNHDNYDNLSPHFLGDFGKIWNCHYVRGAYSIDKPLRTIGIDWWEQEELSPETMYDAFTFIDQETDNSRIKVMLSHDCPSYIKQALIRGKVIDTATDRFLEAINEKSISDWYFGHYHMDKDISLDNVDCIFHCLDELSYRDIEV